MGTFLFSCLHLPGKLTLSSSTQLHARCSSTMAVRPFIVTDKPVYFSVLSSSFLISMCERILWIGSLEKGGKNLNIRLAACKSFLPKLGFCYLLTLEMLEELQSLLSMVKPAVSFPLLLPCQFFES